MQTLEMTTEIFRLLRELMSPLAKVYDPLFAGTFTARQTSGPFYVTEMQQWLWSPARVAGLKPEGAFLTDRQLAESVDLREVLRNLLESAKSSFDVLLQHLGRIEELPTFLTDVGLYLVHPEARVADIIRADRLTNWRELDAS